MNARVAGALLATLLSGCGEETSSTSVETGRVALVDAMSWRPAERDPFADHRPDTVRCPDIGWRVEGGSLEVDTGTCKYLSVEQPLRADVPAGTPITVQMWHQVLHADVPAVGHIALAVGDDVLWTRDVAIPGPAAINETEVLAPRDLLAGESVLLHLHNHGANSWSLGAVFAELPVR